MKNRKKWGLCTLMLLLCAGFFFYLFFDSREEQYDRDARRFVAVLSQGGYYWEDILAGIAQADEELGTFTEYLEYERLNTEEQIELLDEARYMHPDGIITVGEPGSEAFAAKVQELQEDGIPVVLVDADARESGRAYYVGTNNYEAGRLAGEKLAEEMGGQGEILVVVSKLSSSNQQERLDGLYSVTEAYEDLDVVSVIEGERKKTTIDEVVRQAFEEYPDIGAIFCEESSSATQIGYVLQGDKRYEGVKVLCFDVDANTYEFMENGIFLGTIKQDGLSVGEEAVRYLAQRKDGAVSEDGSALYTRITFLDQGTEEEREQEEGE